MQNWKPVFEVARVFLKIGCLAFGGPIAAFAMMEDELVKKRAWVSQTRFLEIVAIGKLLPGPIATEVAIFLGRDRAGNWGGVFAGVCFILPAFLLVLAASIAYVHFGGVPQNLPFFQGLQVGALVAIAVSVFSLGAPFWKRPRMWVVAALAGVVVFSHPLWEPLVIIFLGVAGVAFSELKSAGIGGSGGGPRKMPAFFVLGGLTSGAALPLVLPTLGALLWVCFKGGAFLFGSGLAIVPMLEAEVVQRFHWLTHSEFLDGIAIGQLTPGPLLMTVTFVGYKVAGLAGACLATFGIFFPAFVLVLGILPLVSRWLSAGVGARRAAEFSQWTIYAVLGAIFSATLTLGRITLVTPALGWSFALTFVLGFLFSFRRRVLPVWSLLPIAGAVAVVLSWGLGG